MKDFQIIINNISIMSGEIYGVLEKSGKNAAISYLIDKTNCDKSEATETIAELISFQSNYNAPKTELKKECRVGRSFKYELTKNKPYIPNQPSIPTCPKCGSTSITTGPRGVNFTWGLIGASKTVNRCANCGHMWKPKK